MLHGTNRSYRAGRQGFRVALTDIASIFSRRFIVGFFLPAFFGLVALKLLVDKQALPASLANESGGTQLLILGGVALLLGMLLWGLHYPLIRLYEGYWLIAPVRKPRSDPWPEDDERKHRIRSRLRRARAAATAWFSAKRLSYGNRRRDRWIRDRQRLR